MAQPPKSAREQTTKPNIVFFLVDNIGWGEGTVSDFHPMPYSGHSYETFAVNGVRFSYSDYVLIPCFNNTASHGGPIREGQQVRIAYSGKCILKLEIARNR